MPFECDENSRAKYCADHRGGRPGKSDMNQVAIPQDMIDQRAQVMFEERAQAFIDQHIPLPDVPETLLATRVEDMGFDTPQTAISVFSDLHYGSKIDRRVSAGLAEYNIDLSRERLERWRNGILRFTQMSQVLMTVDDLVMFALGDDIEGHGQMFKTQGFQIEESAGFQVLGFIEDMSRIMLGLLARYKHITVIKVPGNHGRIAESAKGNYPPDNLEIMAWRNIGDRLRPQTGGEWTKDLETGIEELSGGMIDIVLTPAELLFFELQERWTFALRHGHGIGGLSRTYTGAKDNKRRLNAMIGQVINYYIKAHLHEAESAENEIQGEILQNGCFVGASLLSVMSNMASANIPSQEFFLMHPRRGKTHHHRIHLATADEVRQVVWTKR